MVGRAQEHDPGKIEGHVQVVVAEGVVLFGVQHFQQGGRGIAPEIGAQLVHLVQHDDRVAGPGLLDGLDDAAGHGADIGAAVAADLGLVMHAAQGQALEMTAQGPGDGAAQRGLAHAWRAGEAEDGALGLGIELAHAEEFQDAVLDLVQTVMVLVQDGLGMGDVQAVAGKLLPRQFHQPVQIGAHHVGLGGVGVHAGQAAQLLVGFLAHLFGQAGLVQGLAQLVQLFFAFGGRVAQLVADGLDLFAQEVFLLRLVHAFAGRALDVGLHGGHFHLAFELDVDQHQAFHGVHGFEDALGIGGLHAQVGGDEVGQTARLVHALEHGQDVRGGHAAQLEHLFALFAGGAQQGFYLGIARGRLFLQDGDAGLQIGFHAVVALHPGAAGALHQDLDAAVGHLEHAHDLHHRTGGVEVIGAGIFGGFFLLGADQQMAALLDGGLHGLDGFFATDEQRQDHVVEHYDIPNGQHRQQVGDLLFAGGRCLFVAGGPLVPAGGFRRLAQGILQLGQHVFQRMVVLFLIRHIYSRTAYRCLHWQML